MLTRGDEEAGDYRADRGTIRGELGLSELLDLGVARQKSGASATHASRPSRRRPEVISRHRRRPRRPRRLVVLVVTIVIVAELVRAGVLAVALFGVLAVALFGVLAVALFGVLAVALFGVLFFLSSAR